MVKLGREDLKDYEVLTLLVYGINQSKVTRISRNLLVDVLFDKEHPKEGEVHPLIEGRHFTSRLGGETTPFTRAMIHLVTSGILEPVGFNNDYLIRYESNNLVWDLRGQGRISDEDVDFSREFGRKYFESRW